MTTLNRYAPEDSSKEAIKDHAQRMAAVIELSPDHAAILISEIRNALGPAYMTLYRESLTVVEAEEHEDAQKSLYRVVALMDALAMRIKSSTPSDQP